MLAPLPRVYEEGHDGHAVPSEAEAAMIGGDVQVERLSTSAQDVKKRLDVEVLQPIKQWTVAYRTIAVSRRGIAVHIPATRAREGSGAGSACCPS
jgi:hypothetical protein